MPETPTFPLTPIERKFVVRRERYEAYVPPVTSPAPFERDEEASRQASRSLRNYMHRPRRARRKPIPISLHQRLPSAVIVPLANLVAAGLMVFELIYFAVCHPELHPRLARRRLLVPNDVRKSFVVSRTPFEMLRVLGRMFARRLD
jgi:hypothetical protein